MIQLKEVAPGARAANVFSSKLQKSRADRLIYDINNEPSRVEIVENRFVMSRQKWDGGQTTTKLAFGYDAENRRFVIRKTDHSLTYVIKNEKYVHEYLQQTEMRNQIAELFFATDHALFFEVVNGTDLFIYKEDDIQIKSALLLAIAELVATLHRSGVVHHDIKPGNIMKTERGKVFLIDFGGSRLVKDGDIIEYSHGTPEYMSPEQCTYGQCVRRPSDIYNLGVAFYKILSGKHPFGDITDIVKLYEAHRDQIPIKPDPIDPRLRPFVNIVMKCLEKDPIKRFASQELPEAIKEEIRRYNLDNPYLL